ncbi:MAG: 2OG-Fe(II) oxygenase family protein [Acidiferrobacterales bacterium]|nr:2OG-Fe(II) oxygenase family protein [Acidiferrobacterales bacterium]
MSNVSLSFVEQLNQNHHAALQFPMGPDELGQAAHYFLNFLAMPEQIKRQLHFSARSHRASADGYTDKTTIERKDPKQFFHWSPYLKCQAAAEALAAEHQEIRLFFNAAETIYRQVESVLLDLFNHELRAYKEAVFNGDQLADGILRFLSYSPRQEHSFCARAHFDKGFSTLAIADSAPGLRIGCCDAHPLKAVNYGSGTALFMPAWMLFETSDGEIKPVWHDVIHAPTEQNVNALCARWSIVFFINAPKLAFSSWDEVHTPLH